MAGKITTHILDTARGIPGAGIVITLHRIESAGNILITRATTNADGRTDGPLLSDDALVAGIYELTFFMGDYFQEGFLETVPVRFRVDDPGVHYHVPLLCSPWSYSTYRGS